MSEPEFAQDPDDRVPRDPDLTPLSAALAQLYRYWSRTEKLCGWAMLDEEYLQDFQEWLEDDRWRRMDDLTRHPEDIQALQEVFEKAMANALDREE